MATSRTTEGPKGSDKGAGHGKVKGEVEKGAAGHAQWTWLTVSARTRVRKGCESSQCRRWTLVRKERGRRHGQQMAKDRDIALGDLSWCPTGRENTRKKRFRHLACASRPAGQTMRGLTHGLLLVYVRPSIRIHSTTMTDRRTEDHGE